MICDRCGFVVHRRYVRMQYNGLICCTSKVNGCWTSRPLEEIPQFIPMDSKPRKPGKANDYGFTTATPYTGQGTDL